MKQPKERILSLTFAVILILAGLSRATTVPVGAASVSVDTTSDISDGDTSSVNNLIANPGADGVISLREAIEATNNTPGADTIGFNIPGCSGLCTIKPATPLPILSDGGTTIDGYTQPGTSPASDAHLATLLVELDGSLVTENSGDGLKITSANNQVHGLVINRFGVAAGGYACGIEIYGNDAYANTIAGSFIGTDASGTGARMNYEGVCIAEGAHDNVIGGDSPADRNVISGNKYYGVFIHIGNATSTDGNIVSGNYIGTDASGTERLGNGLEGVNLRAATNDNRIGGVDPGERNVISGNGQYGVWIDGYASYIPSGNQIIGNYIGTDHTGMLRLGNEDSGVKINGAQNTTIQDNIISASSDYGIRMYTGDHDLIGNEIYGNYIGTDRTGTLDLGNALDGIRISSSLPQVAQNNTIGTLQPDQGNIISGNGRNGIFLSGAGTSANSIAGNIIGSNPEGTLDLGNRYNGILVSEGVQDSTLGPGNTIAFNSIGVKLSWESTTGIQITENSIYGNLESGIELGDANNDIQAPVISAVSDSAPYQVDGNACPGCSVELFASPISAGQGKLYQTTVNTNGSGQFTTLLAAMPAPYLTATSTDPTDGTSKFSAPFRVWMETTIYLPTVRRD